MNFYKRYMGDYGRDTAHLSLAEHGAYALLLDHYYSTEQALPGDLAALNRICRAFDKGEQKAVASVADAFFPLGEDGLRHNCRADRQIPEDVRLIETARANGKKGGRPPKKTHSVTETKPNGNPAGLQNGTQTEPGTKTHQTPDSRQEKDQKKKQPPASPSALPEVPDWVPAEAWSGFVDMRRKERHPLTARAAKLVLNELARLKADGNDPGAVLDQSTRNGWRDVFALRKQPQLAVVGSGYRPLPGEI